MASDSSPPNPFGSKQALLFAMAGTVALPCPRPATAKVYLGLTSHPAVGKYLPTTLPEYYLRSVQIVSDSLVITRIVSLHQLRAVELPVKGTSGEITSFANKSVDDTDVAKTISDAITSLGSGDGSREVLLFQAAVLRVPEDAPVLVRLVYEFGVTAAMAAENVERIVMRPEHCC